MRFFKQFKLSKLYEYEIKITVFHADFCFQHASQGWFR